MKTSKRLNCGECERIRVRSQTSRMSLKHEGHEVLSTEQLGFPGRANVQFPPRDERSSLAKLEFESSPCRRRTGKHQACEL